VGRRLVGKASSKCYSLMTRLRSKLFSLMISGAFARFGKNRVLQVPIRLSGEGRIEIGDGVFIGANSWGPGSKIPEVCPLLAGGWISPDHPYRIWAVPQ